MRLQYLTLEERERLRQDDPETYTRLAEEHLQKPAQVARAINGRRVVIEINSPVTWLNGWRVKIGE